MRWLAAIAGLLVLLAVPVAAQTQGQALPGYLTTSGRPSGATTPCFVPYSTTNPMPVTATGAIPETASATGTTGAMTATLAASSRHTTYICGFSIRANATAAATGNATVTGTITGTLDFTQWTADPTGITDFLGIGATASAADAGAAAAAAGAAGAATSAAHPEAATPVQLSHGLPWRRSRLACRCR